MNNRMRRALRVTALAIMLGSVATATGYAQVPITEGTVASPGRVEEQLRAPDVTPLLEPKVEVRKLHVQDVPANADKVSFTLSTLILDGATAYQNDELLEVYGDKLGQKITLADLYDIAAEITRKYRNDGYILTQVIVPQQTIEGGTARLRVVEGYIDRISVEGGDKRSAIELIRGYASEIKKDGSALNVKDLERWLLLVNDLPGISVRSIISPSGDKTGAADLRIIVERDPWEAMVGIDNNGSRYLGPVQLSAAGSLNSLLGVGERITGQIVLAPTGSFDKELSYIALSYLQPFFSQGTTIEVTTSYTDTDPGYDLKPFDVEGRSIFASVKLRHPVIRSRNQNLWGHILLDYRDLETRNNIPDPRDDTITAVRAGSRFEYLDTIFGGAVNAIDLELSKGIGLLGASDKGDARLTRPAGDPEFFKANLEIQRLQSIVRDINLLLAVRGQWTPDKLLSSEEFGVGGINYGRAFDGSEIIGDEGVAGKLEVQWNEPYELGIFEDYQVFGFYDAGRTWNSDATARNLKRDTLTSTGLGVRGDITDKASAGLAVAFPLNRDVQTQGDSDPRVYFNLNQRF